MHLVVTASWDQPGLFGSDSLGGGSPSGHRSSAKSQIQRAGTIACTEMGRDPSAAGVDDQYDGGDRPSYLFRLFFFPDPCRNQPPSEDPRREP